jgi:ADP-heptose:LPS heptosyltransferase
MRKLILKNRLSPGDIVMLTAAVRDLHRTYPKQFLTDVRTSCVELWEHNPYLTPLDENDPAVEVIHCHYPLINRCNQAPYHCLHGFIKFLNAKLGLDIDPTAFKGDIHLSDQEKSWFSQVQELTGEDTPFWIVVAGGKFDATIKWWDVDRYQQVVDHFRGKILFVQVGEQGHYHPPLRGVVDLRGQTDLRQLVRLVYHAQGVFCPVTCLMHLAAAVETKPGQPPHRPCVVVAGGREPVHWEAYPHHQFIHTIGALRCCQDGGCWRSRTLPLGDGDKRDAPRDRCVDVVGSLPRCMHLISAQEVIQRIESYFAGGLLEYLRPAQFRAARRTIASRPGNNGTALNAYNARSRAERFMRSVSLYPGGFRGRGIVICAGGVRHFTNAWVCIRMLRRLGCGLPIQLWHLGRREMDAQMQALVAPFNVQCVDATIVRRRHPARILRGWELKPYSILHCPFREVLLLDADNVPVVNPEFLFDAPQFRQTGAVFWPDLGWLECSHPIWGLCGVPPRRARQFESGQVLVDKQRCWQALRLAMWYNEHSDFFYHVLHGDKDTFHLAFHKLNLPFSMPRRGPRMLRATLCQHDFQRRRIFQHRNYDKWNLFLTNKPDRGFRYEAQCRAYVKELHQLWDGRTARFAARPRSSPKKPAYVRSAATPFTIRTYMLSCLARARLRNQTLRNLAATDWGDEPVQVRIDEGLAPSPKESSCRNAFLLLRESLHRPADYVLFLEDDLQFNRFLVHNLRAWRPLRERAVTLASLFNPDIDPLACDVTRNCSVVAPRSLFGSQALILSYATVQYLIRHWQDEPRPHDHRIPRLAGRLGRPVLLHVPSLVQHIGSESTWGGPYIEAVDFDPDWKAPG